MIEIPKYRELALRTAVAGYAEDLTRLRQKLTTGYTKSVPPESKDSPLEITMNGLVISAHFDSKTEILSSNIVFAWVKYGTTLT
jgi:hypothetical protein